MTSNSKFDLWLVRGSHLAQIGLLCITVFTIFYTVIPLYQNASLQESVAKKEKELKDLQKNIDTLYLKHRKELLRNFIIATIHECSPVTKIIMQPSGELYNEHESLEEKLKEYRSIFDKDLFVCLQDMQLNNKSVKELRGQDKKALAYKINSLKPKIDAERKRFIAVFNDREQLKKIGSVKSPATKDFDEFIKSTGIKIDEHDERTQESYIAMGAMSVVTDYGFAFNEIISNDLYIKD
ncbi:hypothetical protein SM094_004278 [Cronobacter malonaticus]|nr:hypothetical protein [Cronobacter malonaticus]ELY4819550.1 hypothetical protein [Cronobacter malonaticus]